MPGLFQGSHNFIKDDRPDHLVLDTGYERVTFDGLRGEVEFATGNMLAAKKRTVRFEDIVNVHLDCLEEYSSRGDYSELRRRWSIFLALANGEALSVAEDTITPPSESTSPVSADVAQWEALATKICALTGKTFVRAPSVPGPPHTFVEQIDQIVQRRLAEFNPGRHSVYLLSRQDGGMVIAVDIKIYREPGEIEDAIIRDLVRAAIDEWQDSH